MSELTSPANSADAMYRDNHPLIPSPKDEAVDNVKRTLRRAWQDAKPRLAWRLFQWLIRHGHGITDAHRLKLMFNVVLTEEQVTRRYDMLQGLFNYVDTQLGQGGHAHLVVTSEPYALGKLEVALTEERFETVVEELNKAQMLHLNLSDETKQRMIKVAMKPRPQFETCLHYLATLCNLKVFTASPESLMATWCLDEHCLEGASFAVEYFLCNPRTKTDLNLFIKHVLGHACKVGHIAWALSLHHTFSKHHIPPSADMFSAMIAGLAHRGDVDTAHQIMSQMSKSGLRPSESDYECLLGLYASQKDMGSVQVAILEMKSRRLKPSADAFAKIMNAEGERGKVNDIMHWYYTMKDMDITPTAHVYNTMMTWWIATNDWQSYQLTYKRAVQLVGMMMQ